MKSRWLLTDPVGSDRIRKVQAMTKIFRSLMISGALVFAPLAAQANVTATQSANPVTQPNLDTDQAAFDAAQQAFKTSPSTQNQINLLSAQLQYQVDLLAFGAPGPVEGVGLPFVLMGLAAGGYAWRRQKQEPVKGRDSRTSV